MYFNSTKMILTNTMMIGVIMTVCSNNWMSMWMGMEISLLSFIPIMQNSNKSSSESMIKYFIIQSAASTIFLFSITLMLIGVNIKNELIMSISMLIKLGSAPFHNWIIMIVDSINYITMMFMFTIIKIPPIFVIHQINSEMLMFPIIISMIMGSIMCINQSSVKKILAYSSIYNVSFMLMASNKMGLLILFISIYSIMLVMITLIFKLMKINFINQIVFNDSKIWMKLNIWINMLSMSGFPPTVGFISKLIIIQMMINNKLMFLMMIMVLTSMIVTMFYMRMAFSSLMKSNIHKKWIMTKMKPMNYILLMNLLLSPFAMYTLMLM